jgi:RNA 3'-terminal phosphate cyclase (ATP)
LWVLEGGTHNPYAPPFPFLAGTFLPMINRMGPRITAHLDRPGFFPAGGGRFRLDVEPTKTLRPLILSERGSIIRKTAIAAVSNLPLDIANRELKVIARKLDWDPAGLRVENVENAQGPGNVLTLEIESEALTEVFTGFGERGVSAEKVAARTAVQARDYLSMDVPVGRFLADQLLVPMAVAGSGCFRTMPPSRHTMTNMDIIQYFLDVDFDVIEDAHRQYEITIS